MLTCKFNDDLIQKIFRFAKVRFLKLLYSNSLIKYLVSNNKIEIELITNDKTLGFTILMSILESSIKPFDKIRISLELKNKNGINWIYGLASSTTNDWIFLKEIGFGNVKYFNFDFDLQNINAQKLKNNNESRLNLFFLEIFSLVYFDYDELCRSYLPQINLFVFDLIKKLPQEITLLEYYYETTGNTKKELKYCVEIFFNKVDDFLKKNFVSNELSLSPIIWSNINQSGYFEINIFANNYSILGELINEFKNEDRGIFFRFEFEMGRKNIKFSSNSGFSKKNIEERIMLTFDEIINKLYFYLYHLEIIN